MTDKIYLVFSVLAILLIGCKHIKRDNVTKKADSQWLEDELIPLESDKDKENYLTNLFIADQELRTSGKGSEILLNNNFDEKSLAYREYIDSMNTMDSLNFLRVKKFLERFGYPKIQYEDYRANYAINAVCVHQPYQNQKAIFPLLYQAHNQQYLSGEDFLFFLNKMHIIKHGTSFRSDKVYTNETDKVNDLIKKLDLDQIVEKSESP